MTSTYWAVRHFAALRHSMKFARTNAAEVRRDVDQWSACQGNEMKRKRREHRSGIITEINMEICVPKLFVRTILLSIFTPNMSGGLTIWWRWPYDVIGIYSETTNLKSSKLFINNTVFLINDQLVTHSPEETIVYWRSVCLVIAYAASL